MDYPPGCKPSGAGIRISVWRGRQRVYDETIPGDPLSKAFVKRCAKRREWVKARLKLGLPIYEDDSDERLFKTARLDFIETIDAKPSSVKSMQSHINHYWKVLDGLALSQINEQVIRRVLSSHDVTNKTKKNALETLRVLLSHAGVEPNPCNKVKLKRHQRPAIERYQPSERDRLIAELSGQFKVYFAVLFGTGLRPGEALALLWDDYDGQTLWVEKQMVRRRLERFTKTNRPRRVYVPEWVRPILENHGTRFRGGYIFQQTTKDGEPHKCAREFNKAWQSAHERLRIPYRIPYVCRHTRAAELLTTGVNPADAAQQMGHSVDMFLHRYSDWVESMNPNRDWSRFESKITKTPPSENAETSKVLKIKAE